MNELIKDSNNDDNNSNDKQNDDYLDLEKIKTTNDLINNFTKNCLEVNKIVNKRIRNKTSNLSKLNNLNDTNLSSSESVIYESSKMTTSRTRKPVKRLNNNRKEQQQSKQLPQPLTTEEWNEYINKGDVIQVNCNSIVGELHKNKFGSGGKGKSIYVNSVDQWMTPIQFEKFCGKSNCKDWKRSIKFGGEQIYKLFDDNVLMCHALSCSCAICSDDGKVIGPIRPFERKRRRKGPEIQAQNAFKKFLCLRPPTLLSSEPLLNRIERIQNSNSNSGGNTSSNTSGVVSNNCIFRNDEMTANNAALFNNSNSSSFSNDIVPHQSSDSSLKYIEKLENDQWTLLEKAADMLISQAKNLKSLIEQAKNQSFIAKKSLSNDKLKNKINQFFNNNNNNMNNSMNRNVNINYTKDTYDNNNNEDDDEDESIDDNDENDEDDGEETEDNEYEYANRIEQS